MTIGVARRLPLTPWFEIVNVPARTSAGVSRSARAR